jgi:thioredoxin-like negative regulator of GroEL
MTNYMRLASPDPLQTMLDSRNPVSRKGESATLYASAIEANAASFQREVFGAAEPVLVGFWTEGSDACKAMARVVESVVEDPSVPFKVVLVNADANEALAECYGVRKVPTLLLFNRDGLQGKIVGHTTEEELRRILEGAARPLQQ